MLPSELVPASTRARWIEQGRALAEIDQRYQTEYMWRLGEWWLGCRPEWGGREEACSEAGLSYETVRKAARLCEAFDSGRRRPELPWGLHADVAALPPKVQDKLLAKAVREQWSTKDMRAAVKAQRRGEMRETNAAQELTGRWSLVYADPPWQYANTGLTGAAEDHYPTMSTDAICAMPIAEHVTDNAVLLLWVTNPLLPDGLRVCEAWGFTYKTMYVWVKNRGTPAGFHVRSRTEMLWVCTRGQGMTISPENLPDNVIEAPVGKHSAKPPGVYDLIERVYPECRKLELFCRSPRAGWDVWGNQV